jgi:SRSO17 transposase
MLKFLKPFFAREEARQTALKYIQGLISRIERKNSWQLAEEAGLKTPYAFQHLLNRALWSADELRDKLQTDIFSKKEGGILAIDETGFLKKGKQSAGVARQYSGTAGRIENCQIGVFLSYAIKEELILVDRKLYIPKEWFEDKKLCEQAGVPQEVNFKTKPQLAKMMVQQALSQGIRPSWVVGDEVYGVWSLRSYLEENKTSYVLAVASNYHVSLDLSQQKVSAIPVKDWQRLSAGKGSKGERYYEWQRLEINSDSPEGWIRYLLFRKSIRDPEEISYYIVFCPTSISLQDMAEAAGSR